MSDSTSKRPTVWYIGGDDIHMRIPLLLRLRDSGFAVAAVGSEDGERFASVGVPYFRYHLERWLNPLGDLRSAAQLHALLREHQPDIVHAFDTKPIIWSPIVAKRAGIPARVRTVTGMGYVFSSHSPLAQCLRPLYRSLHRVAAHSTSMTIFQNPDDRDYFLRQRMALPDRQAIVLGSGIDLEQLNRKGPEPEALARLREQLGLAGQTVVTMVSRLVKTKGVREFIEAARIVRATTSDVTFLLVGPVLSERGQAISHDELEAAKGFVRYLGPRDDVPALLALSDIFALPSYYREGVPRALLEAAAMGLALITTDMPGCREVVRDGWNGSLVEPRDAQSLADAVLRMSASATLRSEMGARSKEHVRSFDLAHVSDKYAELYRDALAEHDLHYVPTSS